MDQGSIVPSGSQPPTPPRRGGLARPEQGPPLHQPGRLGLQTGVLLRDDCWRRLSPSVQERIAGRAGQSIAWYATEDASDPAGRPYAVVLGDRALCIAEPRLNAEHRPVYQLSTYEVEVGSFRHRDIDFRPPPQARWTGPTAPGSPGPSGSAPAGLTPEGKALLGNLPPEAQTLLQAPFMGGREVLRHDWYYEGHEHHLSVFITYLADRENITFATGSKVIPAGHTDATAHWSLRCYRASVIRRVGR